LAISSGRGAAEIYAAFSREISISAGDVQLLNVDCLVSQREPDRSIILETYVLHVCRELRKFSHSIQGSGLLKRTANRNRAAGRCVKRIPAAAIIVQHSIKIKPSYLHLQI